MRELDSDLVTKTISVEGIESKAFNPETEDDETLASKAWEIMQRMKARAYLETLRQRGRLDG